MCDVISRQAARRTCRRRHVGRGAACCFKLCLSRYHTHSVFLPPTHSPDAVRNVRWGTRYGVDLKMEDTLAAALVDRYPTETPMGMTAEKLGAQYGLTRQMCDEYALQSQKRWAEGMLLLFGVFSLFPGDVIYSLLWYTAQKAGRFAAEITPISIKGRKGTEEFAVGMSGA